MSQRVAVSVLVPVRNEAPHIRETLEAMRRQTPGLQVEILLLHGDSTDSTGEELTRVAAADSRFRVIEAAGTSVQQRLNLGLRIARGQLVARMDAHALFPPDYLAHGAARLAQGDVASVCGPQIAHGSGPWSRRISLAFRSALGRGGAKFRHTSAAEIELDSGYCGIWPRSLLLEHGGWNESMSTEDIELAARIRRAGGRIVCLPSMAALYLPRETLGELAAQYWRYGYHRVRTARVHPEALRPSHVLPPALVLTAVAAAIAPRPVARPARGGLGLYAVTLAAESARLGRAGSPGDARGLPLVFATMHAAWGTAFLAASLRHGPPVAALRRLLTRRHERAGEQATVSPSGPPPPGEIAALPVRGEAAQQPASQLSG